MADKAIVGLGADMDELLAQMDEVGQVMEDAFTGELGGFEKEVDGAFANLADEVNKAEEGAEKLGEQLVESMTDFEREQHEALTAFVEGSKNFSRKAKRVINKEMREAAAENKKETRGFWSFFARDAKRGESAIKKMWGKYRTEADKAQGRSMAQRTGFLEAGGALIGMTNAQAIALSMGRAFFREAKEFIIQSVQATRAWNDSVVVLENALEAVGADNIAASRREVVGLGRDLRIAMGILSSDTNRTFADFLTRGFTEEQARDLTILAANVAQKTGKPLEMVQKQIADAANGSVDAIKELGIQVELTGNKSRDAEAAVLAMKAAYGDIGTELVNPSQKLTAAMDRLYVAMGERILPVIEPLIEGVTNFVTGLTGTERGNEILTRTAYVISDLKDFLVAGVVAVENLWNAIWGLSQGIWGLAVTLVTDIARLLLGALRSIPGLDWVLEQVGLDPDAISAELSSFSERMGRYSVESFAKGWKGAKGILSGEAMEGGLVDLFGNLGAEGAAIQEAARRRLEREMRGRRGVGFSGRIADAAGGGGGGLSLAGGGGVASAGAGGGGGVSTGTLQDYARFGSLEQRLRATEMLAARMAGAQEQVARQVVGWNEWALANLPMGAGDRLTLQVSQRRGVRNGLAAVR